MELTPEEIKKALEKSGYLFEQKAASAIEEMGFTATTKRVFNDISENKPKEIDVFAQKLVYKMEDPALKIICFLNCACKNTTNPLVFIMRKKGILDSLYKPDGIFLAQPMYVQNLTINIDAFDYMNLSQIHFATKQDKKAVQICKIIGNNKKLEVQHDGFLKDLLLPLIISKDAWVKESQNSAGTGKNCRLFFNLVIVNSDIYTIDSEKNDALPETVKFVPFISDISSKEIKGKFLVTFIKFDYLKEFIENEIMRFAQEVYTHYSNNPKLVTETFLHK